MNQSNIIFGYVAAAFVIFITLRGALPTYAGFLFAVPKPAPKQTADLGDTSAGGLNATGLSLLERGTQNAESMSNNYATQGTHGSNLSFGNAASILAAFI